jgi:hypothetical protein
MNLASGSGVAIAEASSMEAMMAWSLNYTLIIPLLYPYYTLITPLLHPYYYLITLGRWMDLASGSGVAIAEASSMEAMMAWSLNWTEMAELKFTPVLDDNAATAILKAKYC